MVDSNLQNTSSVEAALEQGESSYRSSNAASPGPIGQRPLEVQEDGGENDKGEEETPTMSLDAQHAADHNDAMETPTKPLEISNSTSTQQDQSADDDSFFISKDEYDVELGTPLIYSERGSRDESSHGSRNGASHESNQSMSVKSVFFEDAPSTVHEYVESAPMAPNEAIDEENDDSLGALPDIRHSNSSRPALPSSRNETSRALVQSNQTVSVKIDLETGKEKGPRAQCAVIRDASERFPQCRRRRGMRKVSRMANRFYQKPNAADSSAELDDTQQKGPTHKTRIFGVTGASQVPIDERTQYRLVSVEAQKAKEGRFGLRPGFYEEIADEEKGCSCFGFQPNQLVISYLFWAFRSSFMAVLLSAACWFFTLTILFAVAIFGIGMNRPHCIYVNGVDFGTTRGSFMDAYALSWTTFSTVGYGLVVPATSYTADSNITRCTGITVLTTLESFVGILVASFWGAIFLSKFTRVSSFAQVTFSDPILIRYGLGVGGYIEEDDDRQFEDFSSDEEITEAVKPKVVTSRLPCPVLEFRVLNKLEGQKHGEIIDASMNIVASVDESQVASSLNNATKSTKRRGGKKGKGKRRVNKKIMSFSIDSLEPDANELEQSKEELRSMLFKAKHDPKKTLIIDEDPTELLVSKKIFAKLDIESQDHPFFKRIWVARHILDQDSPLLNQEAKDLVRLNGGHWPEELNNSEAVRACVHFDQILVSLSGTSNADCNSVYAQKVYDYVDLCVGYRFCNVHYRDENGGLCADPDLLNDVVGQTGGGGENLHDRVVESSVADIFIL